MTVMTLTKEIIMRNIFLSIIVLLTIFAVSCKKETPKEPLTPEQQAEQIKVDVKENTRKFEIRAKKIKEKIEKTNVKMDKVLKDLKALEPKIPKK
jgi:peptidoglycan hydrolase CwlO-like protein